MNGSATSVGPNFQEKVEKEHPEKKGGNGDHIEESYHEQHATSKIQLSLCLFSLNSRTFSSTRTARTVE
jgi:hypothetical protein